MNTQIRCRLDNAIVEGCEVWVPLVSENSLEELERVHLSSRRIRDMPPTTGAKHIHADTGRPPHNWYHGGSKASDIRTI